MFAYPDSRLTDAVKAAGGRAARFTRADGDLSTPEGQRRLFDLIYIHQPEHIFVAPECGPWSSWSKFNSSRGLLGWQRVQDQRVEQLVFLRLCNTLCDLQVKSGRHFHIEQPQMSEMFDQPALLSLSTALSPRSVLDMCRFKPRIPGSSRLIRKRTVIRTTSRTLIDDLTGKVCTGDRQHQQVAGSARIHGKTIRISKFNASYCKGFASAVTASLLKEEHPPVVPATAFPAEAEPPLTCKRFKTPTGRNPRVSQVRIRRRPSEGSIRFPTAKRRTLPGRAPLPEMSGELDQIKWRPIFEGLAQSVPRTGPCALDERNPGFSQMQEACPQIQIIKAFTSRDVGQYQSPIVAPPSRLAPWRMSVGRLAETDASIQVLAVEDRGIMPQGSLHAKCPKCSLLVTIYAGPPQSQASRRPDGNSIPEDPPPNAPPSEAVAPVSESSAARTSQHVPEPTRQDGNPPGCLQGWAPPPVPLHGPNFRSLSNAQKTELVRIHANLGHPSPERLATHLAATGADETIVRAARDYVCDACVESAQPTIARPGKLHEPTEFNQVLGIAGFFWKGRAGIQVYVVHFIDECSCFHLGRRVESRHTSAALPAFQESWVSWAGAPREIYLDPAGELRSSDMRTALQSLNIQAFVTSEAWQRGRVERHGQVNKQMLTRLDQEVPFSTVEEIDTALLQCFRAKNSLVRHQGYSPEQIVLGKSTALPASICSDESCSAHSLAIADGLEADKFRASLDLRPQGPRSVCVLECRQFGRFTSGCPATHPSSARTLFARTVGVILD